MKKILFLYFLALLGSSGPLLAQGGLRLVSNVRMVCEGDINVVIHDGHFNNVSGLFTPGESTVKFVGNASSNNSGILGKPFIFYNLMIEKSQNDVRLGVKMSINNRLIFSQGNLDLNNKNVSLNTSNGYDGILVYETEGAHTYGTGTSSQVTKKITTTGPSQLSFNHLGIRLLANGNFGNSSMDRRHAVQSLPTGNSILKHWRISTASTPSGQNGIVKLYYFDAELNGLNEGALSVWRSTDNGLTWTDMGFSTRSSSQNYVEVNGVADIEGWWTLGAETQLHSPSHGLDAATDNNFVASEWRLAPNPSPDITVAHFHSDKAESVVINLYSSNGELVLSTPYAMEIGANSCELNLKTLSPGVYFAQIAGQNFRTLSVVKI